MRLLLLLNNSGYVEGCGSCDERALKTSNTNPAKKPQCSLGLKGSLRTPSPQSSKALEFRVSVRLMMMGSFHSVADPCILGLRCSPD